MNVYAVHSALHLGASIVYMPTRDAENSLRYGDMPGDFFSRPGITILDKTGKIKREVYDILDLVKEHNATLATGHLGTDESICLCREGVRRGVRMILTHPDWERTVVSLETQKELADAGVWIENAGTWWQRSAAPWNSWRTESGSLVRSGVFCPPIWERKGLICLYLVCCDSCRGCCGTEFRSRIWPRWPDKIPVWCWD